MSKCIAGYCYIHGKRSGQSVGACCCLHTLPLEDRLIVQRKLMEADQLQAVQAEIEHRDALIAQMREALLSLIEYDVLPSEYARRIQRAKDALEAAESVAESVAESSAWAAANDMLVEMVKDATGWEI